jgi:purine-binding chemotaxis protein CheW
VKGQGRASATAQWTTFTVGGELFGFPVDDVQEVLRAQALTPVPLAPPHVAGLLSLRGEIMPALDLRRLFGCPSDGPGKRFVITRLEGRPAAALIVDELGDVVDVPTAGWRSPPETIPAVQRAYVTGMHATGGQVLIGLRTAALVGEDGDDPASTNTAAKPEAIPS